MTNLSDRQLADLQFRKIYGKEPTPQELDQFIRFRPTAFKFTKKDEQALARIKLNNEWLTWEESVKKGIIEAGDIEIRT